MKPNELLSSTGETVEFAKQYIQQQIDYMRLDTAERIAKTTSSLITIGIIAVTILVFFIFLSIAFGFYLGALLNSYAVSFLIVAGLYFLLVVILIVFKKSIITNPVSSLIIKEMFN